MKLNHTPMERYGSPLSHLAFVFVHGEAHVTAGLDDVWRPVVMDPEQGYPFAKDSTSQLLRPLCGFIAVHGLVEVPDERVALDTERAMLMAGEAALAYNTHPRTAHPEGGHIDLTPQSAVLHYVAVGDSLNFDMVPLLAARTETVDFREA